MTTPSSLQRLPEVLPKHVAVIMDGNGRWARKRGLLSRLEGHKAGANSVKVVTECCRRWGISYLTLFSFSTENWLREKEEVSGLMSLFQRYLDSELSNLLEHDIRLFAIGDFTRLPLALRKSLERTMELTAPNKSLQLTLAISYGGREEILSAVRRLCQSVKDGLILPTEIDSQTFSQYLWSSGIPDPELLIRTSGEMRISNFLLWQLAYSEIIVRPELWPDFTEDVFLECLWEYSRRERRFGLSSEQSKKLGSAL